MKKLTELDEFAKQFKTKQEAADALGVGWFQFHRWIRRETFADKSSRILAAQKGVALPVRP